MAEFLPLATTRDPLPPCNVANAKFYKEKKMSVLELAKGCRTYRRFEQKKISDADIRDIMEAARLAPSGRNAQPLSFIVVDDKAKVDSVFAYTKWAGALPPELGQPKDNERPVLFVAVIMNTDVNAAADTDAGLAIQNMSLAAWEKGIGRCILGAINRIELAKIFKLTETQKLHSLVAFGYPSHKSTIKDVAEGDPLNYYLDDNKDYIVPKKTEIWKKL